MKYCFWFSNLIKLTNTKKMRLIESGFSSKQIYFMNEKELSDISFLTDKDVRYISTHKRNYKLDASWMEFMSKGINFITIEQDNFPKKLRNISNCPYCLFYIGRLPSENEKVIAMVGARARSIYGKEVAFNLASNLVQAGFSVISGLALGIDGDSHRGALVNKGTTYGVLASGVDVCYPEKNRYIYEEIQNSKTGGIISENQPGTKAQAMYFPLRNRIISGLSDAVVVVEAREKSGSLISADFALEQGKDVYVVPGRITDELSYGCNKLIYQGAHIILSPSDLLGQLSIDISNFTEKKSLPKIILEKDEMLVYSLLDFRPFGLISIVDELNMSLSRVLEIIESLEAKGYIEEIIPNYFVKVI